MLLTIFCPLCRMRRPVQRAVQCVLSTLIDMNFPTEAGAQQTWLFPHDYLSLSTPFAIEPPRTLGLVFRGIINILILSGFCTTDALWCILAGLPKYASCAPQDGISTATSHTHGGARSWSYLLCDMRTSMETKREFLILWRGDRIKSRVRGFNGACHRVACVSGLGCRFTNVASSERESSNRYPK